MIGIEEHLTPEQKDVFIRLDNPFMIQECLNTIAYRGEEVNRSPVRVMNEMEAHCLDGGVFGAAALRRLGYSPLIVDLLPEPGLDDDHVLAVFRIKGRYGALAKSNFSGLRYREPIYKSLRELVLSYFEDYFNMDGIKTLRKYTRLINLEMFDRYNWMWDDRGVDMIERYLKKLKGYSLFTLGQIQSFSNVDGLSYQAGMLGTNQAGLFRPPKG